MDIDDEDWAAIFLIIIDKLVMLTNSSWTNTTSDLEINLLGESPTNIWYGIYSMEFSSLITISAT